MSYFHKGNRMPLHRNANTPPPKPGYFMVFIYPQVVHSVVFTTNFFVSVVSICTTVTEKKTSHTPHTTPNTHHHHWRRRPRPLPPSVAVHCRFWGSRGGGAEATISRGGGEGGESAASPWEGGGEPVREEEPKGQSAAAGEIGRASCRERVYVLV